MKIAIIGTRGIPARYGGFETCAEELSIGLVRRGHEVTVYCRNYLYPEKLKKYKGIELVYLPAIKTKILNTFSHTFFSVIHLLFVKVDIIMVFNAANSFSCILLRLLGAKLVINVDGLDRKRKKWGPVAKIYYRLSEFISTVIANRMVSDSKAIQKYYMDTFHTPSTFIAYGARIETSSQPEMLDQYKVKKGEYFFVLCRLEPENNTDLVIKSFEKVKTDKKLLIVGGVGYKSAFVENLKKTKDKRIIFFDPVYNKEHIKELFCNAYAYVHGHEVGGTNPALLQAMGCGNCILALNVSFNVEVVASSAILWEDSDEDLRRKMQYIVDHPEEVENYRKKAIERIKECYTWDRIIDGYERLFKNVLKGHYRIHKELD